MAKFQSTKVFDGFSTVFRQWKAEGTHCKFLHGYGVSFRVWFEGELDERNCVIFFLKVALGNVLLSMVFGLKITGLDILLIINAVDGALNV